MLNSRVPTYGCVQLKAILQLDKELVRMSPSNEHGDRNDTSEHLTKRKSSVATRLMISVEFKKSKNKF